MRALIVIILVLLVIAVAGCTPASTQWEHQREMQEKCRSEGGTDCDH